MEQVINHLNEVFNQARIEEIDRFSRKMDDSQRQTIEHITQNMINKILNLSSNSIKNAQQQGDEDLWAEALQQLFVK